MALPTLRWVCGKRNEILNTHTDIKKGVLWAKKMREFVDRLTLNSTVNYEYYSNNVLGSLHINVQSKCSYEKIVRV